MTLEQTRDDIATVIGTVLSSDAFGGYSGMIEPATVRVVPAQTQWLNVTEGTWGSPMVAWDAWLYASATDIGGAEALLMTYAATLATTLGGQSLANGGVCPPVGLVDGIVRTGDKSELFACRVALKPTITAI